MSAGRSLSKKQGRGRQTLVGLRDGSRTQTHVFLSILPAVHPMEDMRYSDEWKDDPKVERGH